MTPVRLWSDDPSPVDLLAFGAVAETAVEAVLDEALDPVAIGISGPWGSGKSTVLKLIEAELGMRSTTQNDQQVVVIETDPWRYDPTVGAKGTLIGEVLDALSRELGKSGGIPDEVESKLKKLAKRVNWVKAMKLAAKTSLTLQLPSIENLSELVSDNDPESEEPRTLDEFRADFEELLADESLSHVRRVVVLVDDLDRCLPETIVETLETMRLFLSVPKMSFVIAADEDRVADAVRERYPTDADSKDEEEPAKLYLHKIVQTTFRLPALSAFDTEAFLLLLLIQKRPDNPLSQADFEAVLASCGNLRQSASKLDAIEPPTGVDLSEELQFAARLTPILYEKLRGSPRRVKRFLNDLNVRSSIATRRGIELEIAVVAKLMILELLLPKDFDRMLDWLAEGKLRAKLAELEARAGRAGPPKDIGEEEETDGEPDDADHGEDEPKTDGELSDELIRWAKLPPALSDTDLSPYLHLAASFTATTLIDSGLPQRLRDVAANLLSSSRAAQKSVTDDDLTTLAKADAEQLVEHLGRMARDRPADLRSAVTGILRVAERTGVHDAAARALGSIPVKDISAPSVLLFNQGQASLHSELLQRWHDKTDDQTVKRAVVEKLKPKSGS